MEKMFPLDNESAKEQSKRLSTVLRKSLLDTLETTLTRVKKIPKELPISFLVQCRPLSTNQMSGRRKTYETKQYIEYRDVIARKAGGFYGISKGDKFRCYVEVGYSNKRADADNCLKPLLDSLTACIDDVFDDSQIYRIEVDKVLVKKGQEYVRFFMEPTEAEWRVIEEFPNYSVSTLGAVKNNQTGRHLTPYVDEVGYARVSVCKGGKAYKRLVHRLVATAFIKNPKGLPVVNHKDEVKDNNNVDNLEWCTHQYNVEYSNTTRYHLINPQEVPVVTTNLSELCRQEGLTQQSLDRIFRGERKSHRGWTVSHKEKIK